jgi:thiol-disulfide isomerase/thioredoxin
MKNRRNVRALLAACFVLAAGSLYAGPVQAKGPAIGQPAPQIVRPALDGHPVDLSALRGKVVLLNFWATWCAPCQAEMPVFSGWQRKYAAQGLQVVGISMDDDPAPVRRLVARLKLNYPVAMGDEKMGARYGGVLGLPLTFLVGKDGKIRARFQGETAPEKILTALRPLLAAR